jgi:hypothetical protein
MKPDSSRSISLSRSVDRSDDFELAHDVVVFVFKVVAVEDVDAAEAVEARGDADGLVGPWRPLIVHAPCSRLNRKRRETRASAGSMSRGGRRSAGTDIEAHDLCCCALAGEVARDDLASGGHPGEVDHHVVALGVPIGNWKTVTGLGINPPSLAKTVNGKFSVEREQHLASVA